jgi:hypothetical protein
VCIGGVIEDWGTYLCHPQQRCRWWFTAAASWCGAVWEIEWLKQVKAAISDQKKALCGWKRVVPVPGYELLLVCSLVWLIGWLVQAFLQKQILFSLKRMYTGLSTSPGSGPIFTYAEIQPVLASVLQYGVHCIWNKNISGHPGTMTLCLYQFLPRSCTILRVLYTFLHAYKTNRTCQKSNLNTLTMWKLQVVNAVANARIRLLGQV